MVALLGAAGTAHAATASFMCNKAKGWLQTTICASDQLADLDLELAVAYARMLRVTKGTARHTLDAEQRSWSERRNECKEASDPPACLEDRYRHQIAALESRPDYPGERRPPPADLPPDPIAAAGRGWTRELSKYQRAIRACREEAPNPLSKALVVWRAGDDGTRPPGSPKGAAPPPGVSNEVRVGDVFGMRLVDWQQKEWTCMAHADGHKVFHFRARDPEASLPDAGPVYHLDVVRPPACRAATQVLDVNGKPAGWISDADC